MKALSLCVANNKPHDQNVNADKVPLAEMERFYSLGYHLIPCGGEDGKKPLRKSWNRPNGRRMPFETVVRIMKDNNSWTYGIRLDGLCVVDCDTWNKATQEFVKQNFPETAFHVVTSRGLHLYFQGNEQMPSNIRTQDIQIDFKRGSNHFVLGPGSIRPDGNTYRALFEDLPEKRHLSRFRLLKAPQDNVSGAALPMPTNGQVTNVVATQAFTDKVIRKGQRNRKAFIQACKLANDGLSHPEIVDQLSLWVQVHCEDAQSFISTDVRGICDSVCKLRTEGRLYSSRNSEFRLPRNALQLICIKCGVQAGNVCLLYCYLVSNHGHITNRPFAIVAEAIANSGDLSLSKSTIDRCKQELKRIGLIRLLRKGKHMCPDQWVLTPIALIGQN